MRLLSRTVTAIVSEVHSTADLVEDALDTKVHSQGRTLNERPGAGSEGAVPRSVDSLGSVGVRLKPVESLTHLSFEWMRSCLRRSLRRVKPLPQLSVEQMHGLVFATLGFWATCFLLATPTWTPCVGIGTLLVLVEPTWDAGGAGARVLLRSEMGASRRDGRRGGAKPTAESFTGSRSTSIASASPIRAAE